MEPVSERKASDALAVLQRWEASGAVWVLRSSGAGSAVVDLLTCDGGEVMGRLESADPEFVAHVLGTGAAAPVVRQEP